MINIVFTALWTIDLLSFCYTMATYTIKTSQHAIDLFPFLGRDPAVPQLRDRTVTTVEPQFAKQIHCNTLSDFASKFYHQ